MSAAPSSVSLSPSPSACSSSAGGAPATLAAPSAAAAAISPALPAVVHSAAAASDHPRRDGCGGGRGLRVVPGHADAARYVSTI